MPTATDNWQAIDRLAAAAWAEHPRANARDAALRRRTLRENLTLPLVWTLFEVWDGHAAAQALDHALRATEARIRATTAAAAATAAAATAAPIVPVRRTSYYGRGHTRETERDVKRSRAEAAHEQTVRAATLAQAELDRTHPEQAAADAIASHARDAASQASQQATAEATQRLRSFMIDGRPLADCTALEALAWCDRQDRDTAWVRMLCQGVPHDGRTLGYYYSGESGAAAIERLWVRVNSQEARAERAAVRDRMQALWNLAEMQADELGPEARDRLRREREELAAHRQRVNPIAAKDAVRAVTCRD